MEPTWTITELAAAAIAALGDEPVRVNGRVRDLPNERLIRWYTTIGLVDPPSGRRGRSALYGERHLLQLVAVKRRQAAGRTIAEIQTELLGATDATLRAIAHLPPAPPPLDRAHPTRPGAAPAQGIRAADIAWAGDAPRASTTIDALGAEDTAGPDGGTGPVGPDGIAGAADTAGPQPSAPAPPAASPVPPRPGAPSGSTDPDSDTGVDDIDSAADTAGSQPGTTGGERDAMDARWPGPHRQDVQVDLPADSRGPADGSRAGAETRDRFWARAVPAPSMDEPGQPPSWRHGSPSAQPMVVPGVRLAPGVTLLLDAPATAALTQADLEAIAAAAEPLLAELHRRGLVPSHRHLHDPASPNDSNGRHS